MYTLKNGKQLKTLKKSLKNKALRDSKDEEILKKLFIILSINTVSLHLILIIPKCILSKSTASITLKGCV